MAVKRDRNEDYIPSPQKRLCSDISGPTENFTPTSIHSPIDKARFTDNGELRAHSEARRQWIYACDVDGCGQVFNRPCRLETHKRSHNKDRPFACSVEGCDKTFPRKDHLQRHLKNSHGNPETQPSFVCDWAECGKSFTSNGRLQRHKEVHESKFYCTDYPPCHEAFRKQSTLDAHVKSQHLEVKPFACTFVNPETGEQCSHGYQTGGALQRHIANNHSSSSKNKLFCMLCLSADHPAASPDADNAMRPPAPNSLFFASKEELAEHNRVYHPPICPECGQQFKNESNLKSHFDVIHANPAAHLKYPCPRPGCNALFNRKHNLAVHVQTVHDKQTRFYCTPESMKSTKNEDLKLWDGTNACGAAFKAKSSLDQHVRTHHLGLCNRKQARKAAKSKKKPEPSMLALLTGAGYDQHRHVACVIEACEHRFFMDRDLRRHLRADHVLDENEVEELLQARDPANEGQFWIGGVDDAGSMFDSVGASTPLTPLSHFANGSPILSPHPNADMKGLDGQFRLFPQHFNDVTMIGDEEAEMDVVMGLTGLPPATEANEGLVWDMVQ